jgi:nitrogenase-associated protein
MATVTFFEKPGCRGNARQKEVLAASGHAVVARSILDEPWTAEKLLPFLEGLPVADWFNRSAPKLKSGEIDPEQLSPGQALALLIAEPILIRRPLMEAGGRRRVGWDVAGIDAWIGLAPVAGADGLGRCQSTGTPCAHDHDHAHDHGPEHEHG